MKTIRRPRVCALLAVAVAAGPVLRAAEATPERDLNSLIGIIGEGKYEHALRALDRLLATYPDDEQLLRLKARVTEAYAREWGRRANGARPPPLIATVAPPPLPPAERAEAGRDFTIETAGVGMVWIAAGTFMMSSVHGSGDDTLVTISRGYWLGRTEVTQEQWRAVMEENSDPSLFRGSDRPVERVPWVDAMEFGRRLTERERTAGRLPAGYEYTLPTEAQWEYACRAGETRSHNADLGAQAWYEVNGDQQTHPVAQLRPNAWGLYDMQGNVSEWCRDGMAGYPGGKATDPLQTFGDGSEAGAARIARGGGFSSSAGQCRPNMRLWHSPSNAGGGGGFRLALAPRREDAAPAAAMAAGRK